MWAYVSTLAMVPFRTKVMSPSWLVIVGLAAAVAADNAIAVMISVKAILSLKQERINTHKNNLKEIYVNTTVVMMEL